MHIHIDRKNLDGDIEKLASVFNIRLHPQSPVIFNKAVKTFRNIHNHILNKKAVTRTQAQTHFVNSASTKNISEAPLQICF